MILDGLGDRPQELLDGKTPLEAAITPNLDKLCKNAETGLMIPYKQGLPLGTEVAHFLLFGYSIVDFPGRGIINALSRGFELKDKAAYLCTSWAYVEEEEGFSIKERWVSDLSDQEIATLMDVLPKNIGGINFEWNQSIDVHGILELEGQNVSAALSDSDPFYDNSYVMKVEAFETNSNKGIYTADIMNKYLLKNYEELKNHPINLDRIRLGKSPANFLLTKWAGKKPNLPTFEKKHGLSSAIVANGLLMRGLANLLEMDFIRYKGFKNGVEIALNSNYEFIHLHTKDTDEAAHTKNPLNKLKVLERIDREIEALLDKALKGEVLLIVTGDHSTPSSGNLIHSGEPVPIMFIGKNVRVDDVKTFGERSCAKGSIRMFGSDLIQMILNLTDRAQFYNFRAGPKSLNHIPKEVNRLIKANKHPRL